MKQRILKNWNPVRVMYFLMGAAMIVYSIKEGMWAGILFGAYFAAMGLFAFGCAGGQCFTAPVSKSRSPKPADETVFDEIK
jgi:hypothetical protein